MVGGRATQMLGIVLTSRPEKQRGSTGIAGEQRLAQEQSDLAYATVRHRTLT